jgi:hypothetical protein
VHQCAADRYGQSLNCTAKDVTIASVALTVPGTTQAVTSCVAGTQVDMDMVLSLQVNASGRYDIGVFIPRDGKSPKTLAGAGGSTDCIVSPVPTSPAPFANLNSNVCGDANSSNTLGVVDLGKVQIPCIPDTNGNLQIDALVSWNTNAGRNPTCGNSPASGSIIPGDTDVFPDTKSNCSSGIVAQIPVVVFGGLTIKKVTNPASDTTTPFSFTASGGGAAPPGFTLTGGSEQLVSTNQLSNTAQVVTVTETPVTDWDNTQIVCIDDKTGLTNPGFVTVDPVNHKITASLTIANPSATCTFTNAQQGAVHVTKHVTGDTGGYVPGSTFPIRVNCGAAYTQTFNLIDGGSGTLSGVPGGTACAVTEGGAAGPMPLPISSNYQYATPTITPVTFNVVAGKTQEVVVENPITRLTSSIQIAKTVTGAPAGGISGDFTFTVDCGADNPPPGTPFTATITLTNGTSGAATISPVPAGAVCKVSATGYPPAPTNSSWTATPVQNDLSVTANAPGPATASFTNTMARDTGTLMVTKVVEDISTPGGGVALVNDTFHFSVTCDGVALSDIEIPFDGSGGDTTASQSITVPAGSVCTIGEHDITDPPPTYLWTVSSPAYTPGDTGTVPANGTLEIKVTNTLDLRPTSSIIVQKVLSTSDGSPTPLVTDSFYVTVDCPGSNPYHKTEPFSVGSPAIFESIDDGHINDCTVTETASDGTPLTFPLTSPLPPTNYVWDMDTPPSQDKVGIDQTVILTNTLKRLKGSIALTKIVTVSPGTDVGPLGGFTGTFTFTADCGTDGTYSGSIGFTNGLVTGATNISGDGSITGIPAGASCTVSENTPLEPDAAAPANYAWGAPPPDVPGVIAVVDGGTPQTASFTNTLTRPNSAIVINKTVTGGPGGNSGTFTFGVDCGRDGKFGPIDVFISAGGNTGSSNTITVPAGAVCTVTENDPPPATTPPNPPNYEWDTTPDPVTHTTVAGTTTSFDFTNNLIRQTSTLIIGKTVNGFPTGADPMTFKFTVTCDDGGTYPQGSVTITKDKTLTQGSTYPVPAGANCTVNELTGADLPPAPPNYEWGSTPETQGLSVRVDMPGPAEVDFTNDLTRQNGSLIITKVVKGPASGTGGVDGDFIFDISCTDSGDHPDQHLTISGGASNSLQIDNLLAGESCTITESAPTSPDMVIPDGYSWSTTVGYDPADAGTPPLGKVTIPSNDTVTETVTNTLVADPQTITITKIVDGATAGYIAGSKFVITLTCDVGGPYQVTLTPDAPGYTDSDTVQIPTDAKCTASEGAFPGANPGYSYIDPPKYDPDGEFTIPFEGIALTVTNTLKAELQPITLIKNVTGPVAGYVDGAVFDFILTCDGVDQTVSVTTHSGGTPPVIATGSDTTAQIPTGAICTVSEGTKPTPDPNYEWADEGYLGYVTGDAGKTPNTEPASPGVTFTVTADGETVEVTNTLTRRIGKLTVDEVVLGPPAGVALVTGEFHYDVNCDSGDDYPDVIDTYANGARVGADAVIPNIPAGSLCIVTEFSIPDAPPGYVWSAVVGYKSTTLLSAGSSSSLIRTSDGRTVANIDPRGGSSGPIQILADGSSEEIVTNTLIKEGPPPAPVPVPLSKLWLLLFAGCGMMLMGIYFQRRHSHSGKGD